MSLSSTRSHKRVPRDHAGPGGAIWLAIFGFVYAAALIVASRHPGPSLWGLHMTAFLPSFERTILLILTLLGAGLFVWRSREVVRPPKAGPSRPRAQGPPLSTALLLISLPIVAGLFWSLRERTYFLGDGIVWVASLVSGQRFEFSEPLAALGGWHATVLLIRTVGARVDATSLAAGPVVCGLAAVILVWMLAAEIAPGKSRMVATGLLLTLGTTQLYFGYIESYPFVSVAILFYLLTSTRTLRRSTADILPGLALAIAVASHVIAVYLVPSYIWLILRMRTSAARKALLLLLPIATGGILLTALGFGGEDLLRPFRYAFATVGRTESLGFTLRGLLSAQHWLDLMNLLLLVLPGPLILLAARASSRAKLEKSSNPALLLLTLAAAPGLAGTLFLVVPSSPAQDWDLLGIMLLPTAAAAITAGIPVLERRGWPSSVGICLLAGAGLFSFVLVNAEESAGIKRFEMLVGEQASLGSHERAYGNEKLATFYADRGDFPRARIHAQRAVDAEPTNPRYWVKAGAALVGLGKHAEAIPYFEEALRRAPDYADASYNLGICYARTKRLDEAISAFRASVVANGTRPEYRHNLGVVLFEAGRADSARLVWTEVLQRWPGYPLTMRSMQLHFGTVPIAAPRRS